MKFALLVVLIALAFVAGVFIQLWIWRVAIAPVTHFAQPTFWQMVGIDVVLGIAGATRRGSK